MNDENEQSEQEGSQVSKRLIFARGFFTRYLIGAVPISAIALIRPDMRSIMVLALAWFFVVCMLGAAADVALGRQVAFSLRRIKLKRRDIVLIFLLVVSLLWLFVSR